MIPKIIHFTWFSNDPYPEKIQRCMDSWKRIMPDYEIIHWDMNRIKDIDAPFLREALAERKWAFAADYVRLYAVANYGGIYLDTDVEVYKSFDPLLEHECFIGRENSWHIEDGHITACYLSSHCFGAVKGHEFIKRTLAYYDSIHFKKSTDDNTPNLLRMDMTILPYTQAIFAREYGYDWNLSANHVQKLDGGLVVYPSNHFDKHNDKDETYCKHLAAGSWRELAMREDKITLGYKIEWRIIAFLQYFLKRFNYKIIKTT